MFIGIHSSKVLHTSHDNEKTCTRQSQYELALYILSTSLAGTHICYFFGHSRSLGTYLLRILYDDYVYPHH